MAIGAGSSRELDGTVTRTLEDQASTEVTLMDQSDPTEDASTSQDPEAMRSRPVTRPDHAYVQPVAGTGRGGTKRGPESPLERGGPGPSDDAAEHAPHPDVATGNDQKHKKKKKEKSKKKKRQFERGVETMFRTNYRTHINLSSLADSKANIMISINGIMISILLATIYPSIAANRLLLVPATIIVLGCLASVVFAVLSARPRVTERRINLDDVRENRANILFFGTFVNMSEDDFLTGMWELIDDPERTYSNMVRDLYGLGTVLHRKYQLLRISYTIFMVGLVLGVSLFLAVYATTGV